MKSTTLLLILFAFSLPLISQDHKMEWFEKQTIGSEVIKMSRVIEDPSSYYMTVRPYGSFTDHLLKVNKNGVIEIDEDVLKDAHGNDIRLYGIIGMDGKIFGYYRVVEGEKASIFRDEINTSTLKFSGHPQEIISGSVNPTDLLKPVWEKAERMEQGYFEGTILADNYAYIDFPDQKMHAILKRETYKGKEQVDLKVIVIDSSLKALTESHFQFSSINTNTSLWQVLTDPHGGLYMITSDYAEKNPSNILYYLAPGDKKIQSYKIPASAYVHLFKGEIVHDGIIMVGLKGEDQKKNGHSLFATKFSFDTKSFSAEKTLSEDIYDWDDRLTLVTNGNHTGVFIQEFTDSRPDGSGRMSTRRTGNIQAIMLDANGQEVWNKTIANFIITGAGGIPTDSYFPFVYNERFYLIQNTHPENPALAAKGEKLKWTSIGKDRFGTELISFGEKGKLDRDFIYLREEKFATIPLLTNYIGNGHYLLYADHAVLGNSFMLGRLELFK